MSRYLLGLLTLPALAGTLAALAGLWWVFGKGVDLILYRLPGRLETRTRIVMATAMVRTRRVYLLKISEYLNFGVFIGATDQIGTYNAVYRAISEALDPPPEYAPPSERWKPKTTTQDGGSDA